MKAETNANTETKARRGGHLRLEKDQVGDSPYLGLKVPKSVHSALLRRAESEGVTISALSRRALEQFVSA
jgi:hypothetical protein